MTEIQAALGISQMQRLDEFVAKRHILQERYDSLLNGLPIIKPYQNQDCYSALHLYPIQIDLEGVVKNRQQIFSELRQCGIGVNVHYIPIYIQPYYLQFGFKVSNFPNSNNYYDGAISIPLFHAMTEEQQDKVIEVLERVLQ
jgi:dTDP-4-amino-4,6-dideoxygalactose transaminase